MNQRKIFWTHIYLLFIIISMIICNSWPSFSIINNKIICVFFWSNLPIFYSFKLLQYDDMSYKINISAIKTVLNPFFLRKFLIKMNDFCNIVCRFNKSKDLILKLAHNARVCVFVMSNFIYGINPINSDHWSLKILYLR